MSRQRKALWLSLVVTAVLSGVVGFLTAGFSWPLWVILPVAVAIGIIVSLAGSFLSGWLYARSQGFDYWAPPKGWYRDARGEWRRTEGDGGD